MTVNGNQGSAPNYEPNSHPKAHNNPAEDRSGHAGVHAYTAQGVVGRHPFHHPNSDFEQPANFYRKVLKVPPPP